MIHLYTTLHYTNTKQAAIIEWMLTEDPFQRPSAEDVALSVAVKNLKKSVKRKRDANIPIL